LMKSFAATALLAVAVSAKCVPAGDLEPGVNVRYYALGEMLQPAQLGLFDFDSRSPTAEEVVDYVNMNVGGGLIGNSGAPEFVVAQYDMLVELEAGEWTFGTVSDDGSRLFVENTEVVNNDGGHSRKEEKGTFMVPETGLYHIYADYFENMGAAEMIIMAGGPNREYTILDGDIVHQWKGVECVEEPVNECNTGAIANAVIAAELNNGWQDFRALCATGELSEHSKAWARKAFDSCLKPVSDLPEVCDAGQ